MVQKHPILTKKKVRYYPSINTPHLNTQFSLIYIMNCQRIKFIVCLNLTLNSSFRLAVITTFKKSLQSFCFLTLLYDPIWSNLYNLAHFMYKKCSRVRIYTKMVPKIVNPEDRCGRYPPRRSNYLSLCERFNFITLEERRIITSTTFLLKTSRLTPLNY